MKDKRGFLDISFSWIFAFLIGAMILAGAIYGINKFSSLKNTQNSAELGTTLKNLLTPLETGIEGTKSISITLPLNSRISHLCDAGGSFGTETFSVQEKIKNKWTPSGVPVFFSDKYVFLPSSSEGQTYNVFSKSFDFPFKIANLIYFSNSKDIYCFVGLDKNTKLELKNTEQKNFEFDTCSGSSIKVCYDSPGNCDIKIDPMQKTVTKDGKSVYYEGDALMYAAIFSDNATYECEVKRLMKRADELTNIYISKEGNLASRGCSSSVDFSSSVNGPSFKSDLENFGSSADLASMVKEVNYLNSINKNSDCRLW